MKKKTIVLLGLAALLLAALSSAALASSNSSKRASTVAEAVREATAPFKDVEAAKQAGYGLFHGCASGQQDGAMGIHFANGTLFADGAIDVQHPEALLYEPKNGKMELVGVEYIVPAEAWNASHDGPPVLMGQLFNYLGAPNRYGLPAIYELHVWAWKSNPNGVFADWNTRVSCEDFVGEAAMHEGH
jgi:hypothetical protein